MKYDELKSNVLKIASNRKFQILLTTFLLVAIIISSSSIRTSNLHLLNDSTTGEKIPLALDPFYFMRIAETIVETDGNLPDFDMMRSPSINVPWHPEILPQVIVKIYDITRIFNPTVTIQEISVISPVIFFIIGTLLFFFLCLFLSGRKSVAILSTALLAYAPSYLYRTMAGFSDHEAIGMIGIFSFFLVYALSLKYFEKSWRNVFIYSILSGFMVAFVLATWGGAVTFVLTAMPFAFLLYWLFSKKDSLKSIIFYLILLISSTLAPLIFDYPLSTMLSMFTSSYGLLAPFVFVFILIDFGFYKIRKNLNSDSFRDYRVLYSLGATILGGIIGLKIIGKSILFVLGDVWIKLINPFGGSDRLGSTVAENSQPYLTGWISANGQIIFWLFLLGILFVGIEFIKGIKKRELKYLFIGSWIFVVSGILFSRISPTSLFNGANFISYSFYLLSLLIFGAVIFIITTKEKFKVDTSTILILAILFFTLINGRSASRVFFLLAPFVVFSASYGIVKLYDYAKKSKEEISRMILWVLLFISIIGILFSITGQFQEVSVQSEYTGPSANIHWQQAMEWTRNNTNDGDIFIHWWDYGYWVQSLGKRPTVTDGGHSGGIQADHYIGRYVLTTPNSNSALSYMRTWDVSYLLIDQTDLGKYPAYSRIGGGAEDVDDRFAAIPVIPADERQTQETANGTNIVFSGGNYIFEDIIYEQNGQKIFLPRNKAVVVGIVVNVKISDEQASLNQPIAIYVHNDIQTRIPLRYAYYGGQLIDYNDGLDAVAFIIPSFNGQNVNSMGAAVYLSSKVSKSLFSQLFLMDDAFGNYPTVKIAHTESNPLIKQLRDYGYNEGEFIYYNNGFLGPIKIWEVDYPEKTPIIEEFKDALDGVYAGFDEVFY